MLIYSLGKAFIPCCAHNGQLVINDGLKYDDTFNNLLSKVVKIVGKCRHSITVQEELRNLQVKLLKNNKTRWNSTLFMIRSILRLSSDELKKVVSLFQDKKLRDQYRITATEREMLEELKEVLSYFEEFTNELQSDSLTISKVYPCVSGLKVCLKIYYLVIKFLLNLFLFLDTINRSYSFI